MNAVDTNILVYAADRAEPVKQRIAIELLDELVTDVEAAILLWQVAVEYVACLRRWESSGRIERRDVVSRIEAVQMMFQCVTPSTDTLRASLELSARYSLSHWDSLLIAAYIEAGVTKLYSEDLDAGMTYGSVMVVNPFAA